MKRRSSIQGDQPKQKVKKEMLEKESVSDEECQIVLIKPAPEPEVDDASFENLEVNNNSTEVRDEIDNSIVCLEDEPQSQSVVEISSESDSLDITIGINRNTRKRVALQSLPINKKSRTGPSKFEKKYDCTLLDKFLGPRTTKIRRKGQFKKTFVDEEITFKFKHPERRLPLSDEGTGKTESSHNCVIDLTSDDDIETPSVQNHIHASQSLPESSKDFQFSEPQHDQRRNAVSKNQQIASSTTVVLQNSIANNHENASPGSESSDPSSISAVLDRLVKNPMIIVTDYCKDQRNVDATKNLRVLDANVVQRNVDENTKTCLNPTILPTTLKSGSPLVTSTQNPLNDLNSADGDSFTGQDPESPGAKVQEKVIKVDDDIDELYSTAFNELESFLTVKGNNEAVMTVLEDLVRNEVGEKSLIVPDITDDAKDCISDSKLQILELCWVESPFPNLEVVKRISQETWLSDQQIINWFVERNKAEISSIVK